MNHQDTKALRDEKLTLAVSVQESRTVSRDGEMYCFRIHLAMAGGEKILETGNTSPRALALLFEAAGDEAAMRYSICTGKPYRKTTAAHLRRIVARWIIFKMRVRNWICPQVETTTTEQPQE